MENNPNAVNKNFSLGLRFYAIAFLIIGALFSMNWLSMVGLVLIGFFSLMMVVVFMTEMYGSPEFLEASHKAFRKSRTKADYAKIRNSDICVLIALFFSGNVVFGFFYAVIAAMSTTVFFRRFEGEAPSSETM